MEPTHIKGLSGKYWLLNGDVVVDCISFNSKLEAEAWGRWSNYDEESPFLIIWSPSEKKYPRPRI